MNKRILWISAVVVTVLALSLDTFAQPQGGGQGRQGGQGQGAQRQPGQGQVGGQQFGNIGGQNVAALLRNEEVVKLLAITAEQTTALNEALRPQRGGAGGGNAGGPPAQLTPAERRAQQETQWTEIGKILKAEQLTKFKDIYFQASVPVVNPNAPAGAPVQVMNLNVFVLGAVNLAADQKEKINKIADEREAAATAARPAQGVTQTQEERTAAATATRERNTKAYDAIVAVLTADQKKKIDELKAGAAKVRTDLNLNARPGGAGAGGQGAAGGGAGGAGRGNAGGGAGAGGAGGGRGAGGGNRGGGGGGN